jgi:pectate lyase
LKHTSLIVCLFLTAACTYKVQQIAFPTAEGFGKFTSGGRGGKVIEVINLNDKGSGSLRSAIQSSGSRTVIFRTSGTIILKSPLVIENNDITIAGQTAPGDGICIRDYPVIIDADNIIIRYMRFRLGDIHKLQEDAVSALFHKNIIVDHCSMSWGIDEVATFRDNMNTTVQWCLISESLNHSFHSKGDHGYAGIWGGQGASFHHNLLAHHSSRNPRFNGSRYHKEPAKELVDYRNNVIFNWGFNSAYGGEAGKHNLIANYYRYGPATKIKNRIVEPWDKEGKWFIQDNFVYGFPEITNSNWDGGVQGKYKDAGKVNSPFGCPHIITHEAEKAYRLVLQNVGAVLPRRDVIDARIIHELNIGIATYGGSWGPGSGIIDSQDEVGGWPVLQSEPPPEDSDHDGMADDWEVGNGLDPLDPEDRNGDINRDGYTNLEDYLNTLTIRKDFLNAPAELTATSVSKSQIILSWKENIFEEQGFEIERADNGDVSFVTVAKVESNVCSYPDKNIVPGKTYTYRVRAYRDTLYSLYTNDLLIERR